MYETDPYGSSPVASAVETTRLNWTAPAPAAAGAIRRISRLTSSLMVGRVIRRRTWRAQQACASHASCSAPPIVTDSAWYLVVLSGSCVWKNTRATICAMFRRIGAAAEERCQRYQHQIRERQAREHDRISELVVRDAVEPQRDQVGRGPGEQLQ